MPYDASGNAAYAAEHSRFWRERLPRGPLDLNALPALTKTELMEHFEWLTFEQAAQLAPDAKDEVALEAADVLLYLLRLCDKCGIDLAAAAERKLAINAERYPVDKSRGHNTKYDKL